jgi:uncharacterized protein YjbJ (UPF0337 family)
MGDKTDRATGKVKETAGRATGDRDLEQEGRDEHAKGKLKKGAKDVKDAVTGD